MSMEILIENALAQIDEKHAEILVELTGDATVEERDTWATKAVAAQAYMVGAATDSQIEMLTTEAAIVGEDVQVLVATVLGRAVVFNKLIGLASGLRRKGRSAVKACSTEEQLAATMEVVLQQSDAAVAAALK